MLWAERWTGWKPVLRRGNVAEIGWHMRFAAIIIIIRPTNVGKRGLFVF
jgi:hypothetical protein